jgi:hypothetical protein
VVGEVFQSETSGASGYLWERGRFTFIRVPGAIGTGAEEINERRQIAGIYLPDETRSAGYVLSKGRFTKFAAPGVPVTQVFGINNRTQVVGYTLPDVDSAFDFEGARGFLLRNGPKGPFTPIEFPGAPKTIAVGINDHTEVVGQYESPTAPTSGPSLQRATVMQSFGALVPPLTAN